MLFLKEIERLEKMFSKLFGSCFGKRNGKDRVNSTTTAETTEDREVLTKNVGKMGVRKAELTFEGTVLFTRRIRLIFLLIVNRGHGMYVSMFRMGRQL